MSKEIEAKPRPSGRGQTGPAQNVSADVMWRQLCQLQGDVQALRRLTASTLDVLKKMLAEQQRNNDLIERLIEKGDENTEALTANAEQVSEVFAGPRKAAEARNNAERRVRQRSGRK